MRRRVAVVTFPAYDAFAADAGVERVTFRVYMHLFKTVLDVREARPVKMARLSHDLSLRPASVIHAVNWLVERGYLIEHERETRRIRVFTLAWSRKAA